LDASPALHLQEGEEVAPGVTSSRPPSLGVRATVLWLYYRDLESIQDFYRRLFRRDIVVDQGWAKVFPVSTTGFLGFVDGERGLHSATEEKAVTVSFFTPRVEDWLARAREVAGFSLRTEDIASEGTEDGSFVETFVGYDPEGYFLEWDTFLDVPSNRDLLRRLSGGTSRP
jgi:predicted enzyme related to lactoylglutathione lyase